MVKIDFWTKPRQVYNGPQTSNLSQQQQQTFWSKMIFEQQNQKKIADFFSEKIYGKKKFWKKFFLEKKFEKFWKKSLREFFQLQVTIPSTHPVQISSRSDHCITLS